MKTIDTPLTDLAKAVLEQMGYEYGVDFAPADMAEMMLTDEVYSTLASLRSANDGYDGFIYYHQTCKFALDNRNLIKDCLRDLADGMGESLLDVVKGFNSLKEYKDIEDKIGFCLYAPPAEIDQDEDEDGAITQILNSLAWYALEEVAYHIGEAEVLKDDEDDEETEEE